MGGGLGGVTVLIQKLTVSATSRRTTTRQATTPTESPLLCPTNGNTAITTGKTTAT
jgi:hypothetical protein